jgi:predicted RNase H-like HicB family nuclease
MAESLSTRQVGGEREHIGEDMGGGGILGGRYAGPRTMHRFLVVIEKAESNYSAYCPDLPGCIATGDTPAETEANMHEALRLHVEGMIEDGEPIPESAALAEYMVVA